MARLEHYEQLGGKARRHAHGRRQFTAVHRSSWACVDTARSPPTVGYLTGAMNAGIAPVEHVFDVVKTLA